MTDQSFTLGSIPLWMENVTNNPIGPIVYSAADFRTYTSAFFPRSGVLGPGYFSVQQADNVGYAIRINPGFAVVGSYQVRLGAPVTMTLPFVHNPSTTCVHRVYLIIHDEAYFANGTGYEARIVAVESIGGANANPPADAAESLELATVTYKPNQASVENKDIVNTARHGGSLGTTTTLTLNPGYLAHTDTVYNTQLRGRYYSPNIVRLAGTIKRTSGLFGTYHEFGRMPAGWWPVSARTCIAATGITQPPNTQVDNPSGPLVWKFFITSDGYMSAALPPNNTPSLLFLDGITYELD